MRLLLVTDRSAGHLFPAVSLARVAQDNQHNVTLFTTASYLDEYLPKDIGRIIGKDLRGFHWAKEGIVRFFEAVKTLLSVRPEKIIGFGGRSSFFFVVLGRLFTQDIDLYEPNVRMGKANRFLQYFTRTIWYGLPPAKCRPKMKYAGIPRHRFIQRYEKKEARRILNLNPHDPVVFCFGGSQGSEFLNRTFKKIVEKNNFFQVIHLTGEREYYQFCEFYDKILSKECFVKKFYKEISLLYSAADLVICRAGALTVSEIIFFRVPAIFVPYPGASGHQRENAFFLTEKEAAYSCEQNESASDCCAILLNRILKDRGEQDKVSKRLSELAISVDEKTFYSSLF